MWVEFVQRSLSEKVLKGMRHIRDISLVTVALLKSFKVNFSFVAVMKRIVLVIHGRTDCHL